MSSFQNISYVYYLLESLLNAKKFQSYLVKVAHVVRKCVSLITNQSMNYVRKSNILTPPTKVLFFFLNMYRYLYLAVQEINY